MWEFCICLDNHDAKSINYINARLASVSNEIEIISTIKNDPILTSIIVACNEIDKQKLQFYITDFITETICIHYKEKFLNDRLKIQNANDINIVALKKALINFDKETDRYLINKNLSLERNINLRSFFNFKLKFLKEKWTELVRIANENSNFLISEDTFIELLKFLIENLDISYDSVNIVQKENGYFFYDTNFEAITFHDDDDTSTDSLMIAHLINMCPKKIIFYSDNPHNNACELVKQLFNQRVTILPCSAMQINS